MSAIRTHYDVLKVAKDAPPALVRAAYRTLSQTYHPDLNPDDPSATARMTMINRSYEILIDPKRRASHDAWIALQESGPAPKHAPPPVDMPPRSEGIGRRAPVMKKTDWLVIGAIGLVIFVVTSINSSRSTSSTSAKPYVAQPSTSEGLPPDRAVARSPNVARSGFVRPPLGPSGKPWPTVAGYIQDAKHLHRDGLSSVTVDNTQNTSDVHVKLVYSGGASAYPIREFYIPAGASFTVQNVRRGQYDIRYRDLQSGALAKSDPIELAQTATEAGTEYSQVTMTLYKVRDGNMQTRSICESEF